MHKINYVTFQSASMFSEIRQRNGDDLGWNRVSFGHMYHGDKDVLLMLASSANNGHKHRVSHRCTGHLHHGERKGRWICKDFHTATACTDPEGSRWMTLFSPSPGSSSYLRLPAVVLCLWQLLSEHALMFMFLVIVRYHLACKFFCFYMCEAPLALAEGINHKINK